MFHWLIINKWSLMGRKEQNQTPFLIHSTYNQHISITMINFPCTMLEPNIISPWNNVWFHSPSPHLCHSATYRASSVRTSFYLGSEPGNICWNWEAYSNHSTIGSTCSEIPISPSDSASHWSFAYHNGIVGNTSVADGALILHTIT